MVKKPEAMEEMEAKKLVSEARKTIGLLASLQRAGERVAEKVKSVGSGIANFYEEKKDFDHYSEQLEKAFEELGNEHGARLLEAKKKNLRDEAVIAMATLDLLEEEYAKAKTTMEKTYAAKTSAKAKKEDYETIIREVKNTPEKAKAQMLMLD